MWTAIWIAVGVGLFAVLLLALREFLLWVREGVLWYWRIPDRIELMEEIRDEQRALNAKRVAADEPAVFSWRRDS
ncbi:hypothetical protein [Caballeronia sp. AZ7_KS35]|uniref:hypothetical protein n=1 Tax=Caballeronia sp. AZ7_KS35 TaxID=2921762 RepID=UPI002028E170|nr:hypothetical protein [Caballeronia sp. AZ7_KS35]